MTYGGDYKKAFPELTAECNGESIIKIGARLPKL